MTHNRVHLPVHRPCRLYPNRSVINLALCFSSGGILKLISTLANLPHAHLQQMISLCICTFSALPMDILTNNHLDYTMSSTFIKIHLFASMATPYSIFNLIALFVYNCFNHSLFLYQPRHHLNLFIKVTNPFFLLCTGNSSCVPLQIRYTSLISCT